MRDNKLIQFYMTNQCNSRCKTCTIWTNKERLDLSADRVIEIITQYPDADYVFGGGEFILYNNVEYLLDFCDRYKINYTILSNAVDFMALDKVMSKYKVPNLTISCDGILHDKIRGVEGNLQNIRKAIDKYKDKTNLKISYTYSKYNEKMFPEDMAYFKVLGFDKIYFCLAQDMELLQQKDNRSFVAESFEQILKYKDMLYDKDVRYIESMLNGTKKPCDSTKSVYTVYTNGDVVMCQSYMSGYIHGNIYDTPFKDIIEGWGMGSNKCPTCEYDKDCNLLCQRRYD